SKRDSSSGKLSHDLTPMQMRTVQDGKTRMILPFLRVVVHGLLQQAADLTGNVDRLVLVFVNHHEVHRLRFEQLTLGLGPSFAIRQEWLAIEFSARVTQRATDRRIGCNYGVRTVKNRRGR